MNVEKEIHELTAKLREILDPEGEGWINCSTDVVIDDLIMGGVAVVVRCANCKYCSFLKDGGSQCTRVDGLLMTKPDDFCSYGIRRAENG